MDYLDLNKDINKLAQEFGLGGSFRETFNLGGNWKELTSSEFRSMMKDLRAVDSKIRDLVTGENTSHESLKSILENIKTKLNRKDYVVALSEIIKFYDIVCEASEELKQLDPDFLKSHYRVLSSNLSAEDLDRLFSLKQKVASNQNYRIVKQAGVLDFLYSIFSSRGRSLSAWEKRFPKSANKLKKAIGSLLRISTAIYTSIINSLKKMKEFRINRNIEDYLEEKKLFISKVDAYKSQFNSAYNSEVKAIIQNIEEAYTGGVTQESSKLPENSVVKTEDQESTTSNLTPITTPTAAPTAAQSKALVDETQAALNNLRSQIQNLQNQFQQASRAGNQLNITSQIQEAISKSEQKINQEFTKITNLINQNSALQGQSQNLANVRNEIESAQSLSETPSVSTSEVNEGVDSLARAQELLSIITTNLPRTLANDNASGPAGSSSTPSSPAIPAPPVEKGDSSEVDIHPDSLEREIDSALVGTDDVLDDGPDDSIVESDKSLRSEERRDLPSSTRRQLQTAPQSEEDKLEKQIEKDIEEEAKNIDNPISTLLPSEVSQLGFIESTSRYRAALKEINDLSNKNLNNESLVYLNGLYNQIVKRVLSNPNIENSRRFLNSFGRYNSSLAEECSNQNPNSNNVNNFCQKLNELLQFLLLSPKKPEPDFRSNLTEIEDIDTAYPLFGEKEEVNQEVESDEEFAEVRRPLLGEGRRINKELSSGEKATEVKEPGADQQIDATKISEKIEEIISSLSSDLNYQDIIKIKSLKSDGELASFLRDKLTQIINEDKQKFTNDDLRKIESTPNILDKIKLAQKIKTDFDLKEYQSSYKKSYKDNFTKEDVASYTGNKDKQMIAQLVGTSLEKIITQCFEEIFNKVINKSKQPSAKNIFEKYDKLIRSSLDLIINSNRNVYYSDEEVKIIIAEIFQQKYKENFTSLDDSQKSNLFDLCKQIFTIDDKIFTGVNSVLRRQGEIVVGKDIPISSQSNLREIDSKYLESDDLSQSITPNLQTIVPKSPTPISPASSSKDEGQDLSLEDFLSEMGESDSNTSLADFISEIGEANVNKQESDFFDSIIGSKPSEEEPGEPLIESEENIDARVEESDNPVENEENIGAEKEIVKTPQSEKINQLKQLLIRFLPANAKRFLKDVQEEILNLISSIRSDNIVNVDFLNNLEALIEEIESLKALKEVSDPIEEVITQLTDVEDEVKKVTQPIQPEFDSETSEEKEQNKEIEKEERVEELSVSEHPSIQKINYLTESLNTLLNANNDFIKQFNFDQLISYINTEITPIIFSIEKDTGTSPLDQGLQRSDINIEVNEEALKSQSALQQIITRIIGYLNILKNQKKNIDSKHRSAIRKDVLYLENLKGKFESVGSARRLVDQVQKANEEKARKQKEAAETWDAYLPDTKKQILSNLLRKILMNPRYNSNDLLILSHGLEQFIKESDKLSNNEKSSFMSFVNALEGASSLPQLLSVTRDYRDIISNIAKVVASS